MVFLQLLIVIAISTKLGCTEKTEDAAEVSNTKLCSLEKDILSLKTLIANQDATIARQNVRIAEMSLKNYQLDTKVSTLTELLTSQQLHDEMQNKTERNNLGTVAFMATPSTDVQSHTQHQIIVFGNVVTNVGNAYNPTTGIFTSPSDGVYNFQWSVTSYRKKILITELVINGKRIICNHADSISLGSSTFPSTMTATVEMKEGDQVWVRKFNNSPGQLHGNPWSAFSGYKLST